MNLIMIKIFAWTFGTWSSGAQMGTVDLMF